MITLWAIMKYVSRPKNAAVKDDDSNISDISGQKYQHRYQQRRYRPTSNPNTIDTSPKIYKYM